MRRSLFTWVLVFTVIGLAYLYFGWRLADAWWGWVLIALPFLSIVSFPLRIRSFRSGEKSGVGEVMSHLSFLSMGIVTYLLVFTVLRDVIQVLVRNFANAEAWAPDLTSEMVAWLTLIAMLVGSARAFWGPQIIKVKVPIEGLAPELEGVRIAQISDLHVGPTIQRRYVERVLKKVNSIEPDLILFTGDIGDGPAQSLKEEIAPLKGLKAKSGLFYAPGNHEYYWNLGEWLEIIRGLGVKTLLNQGLRTQVRGVPVYIAGIPDPAAAMDPRLDQPNLKLAFQGSNAQDRLKILLSHRPGFAKEASEVGFDLQLSGHTHGGQFFPWTIVVHMVHQYAVGLHRVGKMWIYVNSGTGSWGPLIRLGTTPEITQLELTAAKNSERGDSRARTS